MLNNLYPNGVISFLAIPGETLSRRIELPLETVQPYLKISAFQKFVTEFNPNSIEQRKIALALYELSQNSKMKWPDKFYAGCNELYKKYDDFTTSVQEKVDKLETYYANRQQITKTTESGILISEPVDKNQNEQPLTLDKVEQLLINVSPILREHIKCIKICDYETPGTLVWRLAMMEPNLPSADAEGEYDTGTIYLHPCNKNDWEYLELISHEAAHCYDRSLGRLYNMGDGVDYSSGEVWSKAIEQDKMISGIKSVTDYGEFTNSEDFAESMAYYFTQGKYDILKNNAPNRLAVINELCMQYESGKSR